MRDDLGPGIDHPLQVFRISLKIRDQDFHGGFRIVQFDHFDGRGPESCSSILQIIPCHGSNDTMLQGELPDGFSQPPRFFPVQRIGDQVVHITEPAVPGAFLSHDHETGGSGIPAFSFVGTIAGTADGI